MLAIRSMSSSCTLASLGTGTSRFSIIRFRSCSCTTLASVASVNNYLQEVIVICVGSGKHGAKQGCKAHKRVLAQMRFVFDLDLSAVRRQHPNRDLESTSARLYDSDCPITGFRSADDPKSFAVQRVEGIENLNVNRFRTQGIVGVGVITRTYTA